MALSLNLGQFGPLSAALAKDLAALTEHAGLACSIGTATFNAVPEYIGKDILASMGISGVRGTVMKLSVLTPDLPNGAIKFGLPWAPAIPNRTPIIVGGQPMLVRDSYLEGDGSMTVIYCEQAP